MAVDIETGFVSPAVQDSAADKDGKVLYYHVAEDGQLFSCRAASREEAEQLCFDWLQNRERHG